MANLDWDPAHQALPMPPEAATVDDVNGLRLILANHEGRLSRLDVLIASVQSTKAAWIVVKSTLIAVVVAAAAFLGAYQIYIGGKIDSGFAEVRAESRDRTSTTDERFAKVASQFNDTYGSLNDRMTAIEIAFRSLPASISQEMLAAAANFATIRNSPPPAPQQQSSSPRNR